MQSPPPLPDPPALPPKFPARQSMLAWWGIIPALIFIVVQCYFGWSRAQIRASGPDFALSYLMGGLVGGLGIALLLALILYRIDSRSQRTATITFSAIVMLFVAGIVHQA